MVRIETRSNVTVPYGDRTKLGVAPLVPHNKQALEASGEDHGNVPVLVLMIPFAAPYLAGWEWEPAVALPNRHTWLLFIDGLAFMSSLNESIMCWQSVGATRGLFRSHSVVAFELAYKVLIFTAMAAGCALGCAAVDAKLFLLVGRSPAAMATSPIVVRTVAYLTFVASKYPSMGKRAIRKLQAHLERGDGAPPLSWDDVPAKRA